MNYYRVFHTDLPVATGGTVPDLSIVIPIEFTSKDDALQRAFKLIFDGAVVWKIEGPGDFNLQRAEIRGDTNY